MFIVIFLFVKTPNRGWGGRGRFCKSPHFSLDFFCETFPEQVREPSKKQLYVWASKANAIWESMDSAAWLIWRIFESCLTIVAIVAIVTISPFPGVWPAGHLPPVWKSLDSSVSGLLPSRLPHCPTSWFNLRPHLPSDKPRRWPKKSGRHRQWKSFGQPAPEAPLWCFRRLGLG